MIDEFYIVGLFFGLGLVLGGALIFMIMSAPVVIDHTVSVFNPRLSEFDEFGYNRSLVACPIPVNETKIAIFDSNNNFVKEQELKCQTLNILEVVK